jgi:threonine/homoserine/homoserine lactone efflux protein
MDARLLAFVGIAALITVTPGPDMALVTRETFARGSRAAWWTALGIVTGLLVWAMASAVGIAPLLHASATLSTTLRLAGAAYLIFLGIQPWLTRAPMPSAAAGHTATVPPQRAGAGAYRQGATQQSPQTPR